MVCPCPPWYSNDSWTGSFTWDGDISPPKCLGEELEDGEMSAETRNQLYQAEITYECPDGFVFETPELLAGNPGQKTLTMTCEKNAAWSPTLTPKCVRKYIR